MSRGKIEFLRAQRRDPRRMLRYGYPVCRPAPMIIDVIRAAALATGLSRQQLTGRQRSKVTCHVRFCAIWVTHNATDVSLPEIGRRFDRDHSTIYHALLAIERRLDGDCQATQNTIMRICAALAGRLPTPPPVAEKVPAPQSVEPPPPPRPIGDRWRANRPEEDFTSRNWFAENDAAFREAFAAAHPERVRA